jgi:hypothetical protein
MRLISDTSGEANRVNDIAKNKSIDIIVSALKQSRAEIKASDAQVKGII